MAVFLALALLLGSPLAAQPSLTPPGNPGVGFKLPSGDVEVALACNTYDAMGYAPIQVSLIAKKVSPADRTYTIDLWFATYGDYSGLKTTVDLELPGGQTAVSKTITVARLGQWFRVRLSIWGDGRPSPSNPQYSPAGINTQPLNMRSATRGAYSYAQYSQWPHEEVPHILIVSKSPADQAFRTGKVDANGNPELIGLFEVVPLLQAPGTQVNSYTQHLEGVALSTPDELNENWINYTSLDVIGISLEDLARLAESRPAVMQAIRDWTFAGGNLWVWGMGTDWSEAPEFEMLLKLSPGTPPPENNPSDKMYSEDWRSPLVDQFVELSESADPYNTNQKVFTVVAGKPKGDADFALRRYGLGQVAAILSNDALHQWTASDWGWLCNAIGTDQLLWSRRHGITALGENSDFWNFLISGVGLPPVSAYRVLITLFVVFIGPINYWVLRHWRRLHLLLFTVPACAGVVTLALLGYALISDGLGTRVRVRSFTEIDQRSGRSATWSRLSYYAGLKPSGGLTFPTDVAVFPIHAQPQNLHGYEQVPARTMIWSDEQKLTEGWLNAREPTQFITVRSGLAQRELKIDPGTPREVQNQLGGRIVSLVLAADDGQMYVGSDIAPGAKVTLQPLAEGDAFLGMRPIHDAIDKNRPNFPPDWQAYSHGPFGFRRNYYYSGNSMAMSTSRLEKAMEQVSIANQVAPLPPRSYLAVVDRLPDVAVGVKDITEVESFYIVFGRW